MNAYDVLKEHHTVLRGLCRKISATPLGTAERQEYFDELMVEFDIHMRVEDDLYYPAMSAASTLIAIAHAEHRQIFDQLAVLLRTPPTAPEYEDEWESFKTVLEAHADEEERDLVPPPPPVELSDKQLDELGNQMTTRIKELRESKVHKLRVKGRSAMLRALQPPASHRPGHSTYRHQRREGSEPSCS